MHHFDKHQILSNLQHDSRRGHSCQTHGQLIAFVEHLAMKMENGGQTDVIVMDFPKPFDRVANGINTVTLSWIRSFLPNKKKQVGLNKRVVSVKVIVSSGVPQGSAVGPNLFKLYIYDLPHYVKSKVRLFADDIVIYLAVTSMADCVQLQQNSPNLEN